MTPERTSAQAVLTNSDIAELTDWRRELHKFPELSGEEAKTAERVAAMLKKARPDNLVTGLGGHGVAAIFDGKEVGPSVLFRCELDGLPIQELNPDLPHVSQVPGKGHLCGHDGHMTILAATARWMGRNRPDKGRVILLFQPAEEDGSGAQKVLDDPRFEGIRPDYSLSLHNFPGLPLGHAVISDGPMNCASRGMKITLRGRTSHASQPEMGVSPSLAIASLIQEFSRLGNSTDAADPDFSLVTVTHARLGEPAFGVAPGYSELWITLRTQKDARMEQLAKTAQELVEKSAAAFGLEHEISLHDVFHHCENDSEANGILRDALRAEGIPLGAVELPMRGSEDFGRFGSCSKSAMFLLGSGTDMASLHNPDFDFPDDLIPIGARVFIRVVRNLCFHPR